VTYTDKIQPSWEEVARLSDALAAMLAPRRDEFRTIIAITRGGMVPAAIIARRLGMNYIDTVGISSYEDKSMGGQGDLQIIKTIPGNGEGCLVIDDLVDKGTTAQLIRQMLPKSVIAVLYTKPSGRPFADVAVEHLAQHVWVQFPWEDFAAFPRA
jgi:xanthine phosphoribosyltransferase